MFYWCKRPAFTCFRRQRPDEIFPMLHFTTITVACKNLSALSQRLMSLSASDVFICSALNLLWRFLFSICESCSQNFTLLFVQVSRGGELDVVESYKPSFHLEAHAALGSGFTVCHFHHVEKFSADSVKNFYLTLPTRFQPSGAALWLWSHAYSRI